MCSQNQNGKQLLIVQIKGEIMMNQLEKQIVKNASKIANIIESGTIEQNDVEFVLNHLKQESAYINHLEQKLNEAEEDLTHIEQSYLDLYADYLLKTQNSKPSLLKTLIAESTPYFGL